MKIKNKLIFAALQPSISLKKVNIFLILFLQNILCFFSNYKLTIWCNLLSYFISQIFFFPKKHMVEIIYLPYG